MPPTFSLRKGYLTCSLGLALHFKNVIKVRSWAPGFLVAKRYPMNLYGSGGHFVSNDVVPNLSMGSDSSVAKKCSRNIT